MGPIEFKQPFNLLWSPQLLLIITNIQSIHQSFLTDLLASYLLILPNSYDNHLNYPIFE